MVSGFAAGTMLLLGFLLHEIEAIHVQARRLAVSAQIGDLATDWAVQASACARERIKYVTLGDSAYLLRCRAKLAEIARIQGQAEILAAGAGPAIAERVRILSDLDRAYAGLPAPVPATPRERARPPGTPIAAYKAQEAHIRQGILALQEAVRLDRRDRILELRGALERAVVQVLWTLVLMALMVAYLALVLKFRILSPLKALEKGAAALGRGQLGVQVPVHTRDEIGRLAEVLNAMSRELAGGREAEVRSRKLEAIEQVVRSVNHEINNPLMVISGNAEFLAALLGDADPSLRARVAAILEEVARIHEVTQKLRLIREPVTEAYTGEGDRMIDLARASHYGKAGE